MMRVGKGWLVVGVLVGAVATGVGAVAEEDAGRALRAAATAGDSARVEAQLAAGTDPNAATEHGATALAYAADKGHAEVVRLLIAAGAEVNRRDSFYNTTPLSWAAYNGHVEVVALLLDEDAEGAAQALTMAIERGQPGVAATLATRAGLSDDQLAGALAMARNAGDAEVVAALVAATAPPETPDAPAPADWPSFRGPRTTGLGDGDPPVAFDAENGVNLRWKTAIPGLAHSSPIVSGGKVFVTSAVSDEAEPTFRPGLYGDVDTTEEGRHAWRLFALDAASGEMVWERTVHEGPVEVDRHIKSTHANSTPATDGRVVVSFFGSAGVLAAHGLDGSERWKVELEPIDTGWFYDPSYQWGHASSPVIWQDRVLLQVDRSKDSYLAAYALSDGRRLWRTPRAELPSWGTPAVVEGPRGPEVVAFGGKAIRGYDPRTGEELWQLGPVSAVTVASPVPGHGLVYVSNGYRPVRPVYAIRPGGRGDVSLKQGTRSGGQVAWSHPSGGNYITTPIVVGEQLYTLGNNGVLTCYDALSGEQLYRQRVGGGQAAFSGSMVAAGGRLYLPAEDGEVFVVAAGPEYELLATNTVGEVLMATPAIADGVLYVRGLRHVFAFAQAPGAEAEGADLVEQSAVP